MLREVGIRNSSPLLSKPHLAQNIDVQPFPLQSYHVQTFQLEEGWPILWNNGKNWQTTSWSFLSSKTGSRSLLSQFLPYRSSSKTESIFLPVIARRNRRASQEMGSGRFRNPGTPRFYSRLFLVPKKNGRLRPVIDPSLLNQYINEHHFKVETVHSVRQSIRANDLAVSIDLTDAYLHVPIHPISRKYFRFVFEHQVFQFTALPFGMSLSPYIFMQLMNVVAAHLRIRAVSLFPNLDDWLIRDLIRNRLISHTKYTLQMVQNLGFIPNLNKSNWIPTQRYTFIGMVFLTQQEIVRVPADRVKDLILTIKTFLSQVSHELSFLFWANSLQQQIWLF